MVRRRIGIAGLLASAALCVCPAGAARAEAAPSRPSAAELSSARRLFASAIDAEDHGRWAEALEKYERVGRVAESPSLHYHLAVCYEALGHLVEAVNAFELAASGALARGEAALARESQARLSALRSKTAEVTIRVPDDAEDVRIEIDGEPLNAALAGSAVLIPPGERRVRVRARNYDRGFEATVRVPAGRSVALAADLGAKRRPPTPARDRAAAQAPDPAAAPAPAGASTSPPLAPEAPSRAPAFVAGATALALAAGAVATGVAAYDVRGEYLRANEHPTPGSLEERQSLRDRGQALAITSTALTGGALLAGAVATYLFWPAAPPARAAAAQPRSPSQPQARFTPWVSAEGAGLGIGGAL